MQPFTTLTSRIVCLPNDNIDTDQIIPARFLKVTDKAGLGENVFADWRYAADGTARPDFVLNRPEMQGRQILLAGANFGCGSSREHAPWALLGWGFRAVVSTSFADIFRNNAFKNGLLPVALDLTDYQRLLAELASAPDAEVTIDLPSQSVRLPDGQALAFPIDSFNKYCLLNGLDQLQYLQEQMARIEAYEGAQVGRNYPAVVTTATKDTQGEE
jgi:3-isopropylmalate/(R)-2-methylmalate dehydratase small subunit